MITIDMINNKISELSVADNQHSKIEEQILELTNASNAIDNDKMFAVFNFTPALQLTRDCEIEIDIDSADKMISAIKKAIKLEDIYFLGIPMPEEYKIFRRTLKEKFETAKNILQGKKEKLSSSQRDEEIKASLIKLKSVLEGTGEPKYYTSEMLDAFISSVNILDMPYDDCKKVVKDLYSTANLVNDVELETANYDDIIDLYKEYVDDEKSLYGMLDKYKDEIMNYIDLNNAREILKFFKDKGILEKFKITSLVKITVFSALETVNKVYEEIFVNHHFTALDLEMYFEDISAPLWIDDDETRNKTGKIIVRGIPEEKKDKKSLYSQSHNHVSLKQFWRNCDLLDQYSDLFSEKYDLSNLGAHLKVKTSSEFEGVIRSFSKILRGELPYFHRNLSICRLFGLGQIYKLPVSLFEVGSIETKIHLAIELGLLNPPMTDEYIQIEKGIVKSEDFQMNIRKKGYYNQSIRNYFLRYLSSLAGKSVNDYGMLYYKLLTMGRKKFYQEFFSEMIADQGNPQFIKEEDEETLTEKVKETFEYDSYSELIEDYTKYSDVIEEYDKNPYNDDFDSQSYFDEKILSDPLIEELEQNHCVNDKIARGEKIISVKNEYVYIFDDRIISRYKVLHNASILKRKFGYLDENMLLSSIVKKSYIDSGTFDKIKKEIVGRRKTV